MAYALAWHHGAAGQNLALARALEPEIGIEERNFYLAVATATGRRYNYLRSLDTASRYLEAPVGRFSMGIDPASGLNSRA